ncbi:MAG: CDP-alcohol phosphatidyltransferase family protein [Promethearchaeia archaeon]
MRMRALSARMYVQMDQKSVLGSYLDPLADKVLIMSLSCTCAAVDLLPWYPQLPACYP